MKNLISKILIVFILIILALFVYQYAFKPSNLTQRACIKEACFNLEIAQTPEERQKGLMFRSSLNQDAGMLFIFPEEGIYPFWMKNTLIPLDIIWINKDKKIIHIENNVPPCKEDPCPSYSPEEKALYVLEINAGLSKKYEFKEGDKVKFILKR